MKTKISKATDLQLNWLVAKCEGYIEEGAYGTPLQRDGKLYIEYCGEYSVRREAWQPTVNWLQGGPISEREWLHVEPWPNASKADFRWSCTQYNLDTPVGTLGPTPLIAAMRCYVSSKLGDEVDLPEDLK